MSRVARAASARSALSLLRSMWLGAWPESRIWNIRFNNARSSLSRVSSMSWRPPAEMQRVRLRQETGRFSEANCISEFTEVVAWLGYGPVVHGVDEVEGRMPAYQFEPMPPDLSHSQSLSPAKAI